MAPMMPGAPAPGLELFLSLGHRHDGSGSGNGSGNGNGNGNGSGNGNGNGSGTGTGTGTGTGHGWGHGHGYGGGSGSGYGYGTGTGTGHGTGRAPFQPPPKETSMSSPDPLSIVREILENPITPEVLEAATDAAIDHLGIDGDELKVHWSTQRPRRDAVEIPGFASGNIPCVVIPNPTGTAPTEAERAAFLTEIGCKGLKWDGRTGAHWLVLKVRHLKGLKAWAVVDKSAVLGEDPNNVVHEAGDLQVFLLETEAHLVREGRLGRHCIGSRQMGYRRALTDGSGVRFVSVRKRAQPELPLATGEISASGRILQLQGRSNSHVKPEVRAAVEDWINNA